jgi:hypothetical protein
MSATLAVTTGIAKPSQDSPFVRALWRTVQVYWLVMLVFWLSLLLLDHIPAGVISPDSVFDALFLSLIDAGYAVLGVSFSLGLTALAIRRLKLKYFPLWLCLALGGTAAALLLLPAFPVNHFDGSPLNDVIVASCFFCSFLSTYFYWHMRGRHKVVRRRRG